MRRRFWGHRGLALLTFWGAVALANVAHAADGGAGIACPNGNECGDAGVLTCIDGYCCNDSMCGSNACAACNGLDRGWAGAVNGICSWAPNGAEPRAGSDCYLICGGMRASCVPNSCSSSRACASGFYCGPQGTCVPRLAQGAACPSECMATGSCDACPRGYCADGVCCDMACDGECVACTAALKAGMSADGVCGPVPLGTDEHKCGTDQPCGRTGLCDDTGHCANHLVGDPCIVTDPDVTMIYTCNAEMMCAQHAHCEDDGGCSDGAAAAPSDAMPGNASRCQGPECADASLCVGAACGDASTSATSDGAANDLPRCDNEHTLVTAGGSHECPAFSICRMGSCGQPCGGDFCVAPKVCLLSQQCGVPDADQPPAANCSLAQVGSRDAPSGNRWSLPALALLAAAWQRRRQRSSSPRSR